eukprot:36518_1
MPKIYLVVDKKTIVAQRRSRILESKTQSRPDHKITWPRIEGIQLTIPDENCDRYIEFDVAKLRGNDVEIGRLDNEYHLFQKDYAAFNVVIKTLHDIDYSPQMDASVVYYALSSKEWNSLQTGSVLSAQKTDDIDWSHLVVANSIDDAKNEVVVKIDVPKYNKYKIQQVQC